MSGILTGAVLRHAPYGCGFVLTAFVALADAANDDGLCWFAAPELATRAHQDVRDFQRSCRRLEADGYLLRTPRNGHTNEYRLRLPREWGALSPVVTGEKEPDGRVYYRKRKPAPRPKRDGRQLKQKTSSAQHEQSDAEIQSREPTRPEIQRRAPEPPTRPLDPEPEQFDWAAWERAREAETVALYGTRGSPDAPMVAEPVHRRTR